MRGLADEAVGVAAGQVLGGSRSARMGEQDGRVVAWALVSVNVLWRPHDACVRAGGGVGRCQRPMEAGVGVRERRVQGAGTAERQGAGAGAGVARLLSLVRFSRRPQQVPAHPLRGFTGRGRPTALLARVHVLADHGGLRCGTQAWAVLGNCEEAAGHACVAVLAGRRVELLLALLRPGLVHRTDDEEGQQGEDDGTSDGHGHDDADGGL